jgi:hypothetical protein
MLRRFNAVLLYVRRFLNYFQTSSPYVSGDSISDLCGIVYFPHKFWKFRNIFRRNSNQGLVFCPSSNYLHLIRVHKSEKKIPVLVLGNGDHDFGEVELKDVQKIAKRVYVQNLNYEVRDVSVLPIGIENLRLGQNGRRKFVRNRASWSGKKSRVLIGPFSNTHPERQELLGFSNEVGPWDVHVNFISPKNYAKISEKYKYIACPRGNGLDTHRFWETLYRGSIPIVKESNWSRLIGRLGVPLLTVPEWTPEALNEAISGAVFVDYDPRDVPALWINYWKEVFNSDLEE